MKSWFTKVLSLKKGKFPLGILYVNKSKSTFEENVGIYQTDDSPLYERNLDKTKFENLLESFR